MKNMPLNSCTNESIDERIHIINRISTYTIILSTKVEKGVGILLCKIVVYWYIFAYILTSDAI